MIRFAFRQAFLFYISIASAVAACAVVRSQTTAVGVRLIDQTVHEGSILNARVDSIAIQTNNGNLVFPIDQVQEIKFLESGNIKVETPIEIFLWDGSKINAAGCELDKKTLRTQFGVGTKQNLKKRNVRAVVFSRPQEYDAIEKQIDSVCRDKSIAGDTLIVFRSGEFNSIEGIVGGLNSDSIKFSIDDQTADVSRKKVSAVTFFNAIARSASVDQFADPIATCKLTDGSTLRLGSFLVEANKVEVSTLSGEKFEFALDRLALVSFKMSTVTALTSLPPSTNDWSPLIAPNAVREPLRKLRLARIGESFDNRNIELEVTRSAEEIASGKARTNIETYDDGIAMRGGGRLAWRLDGQYKRLRGTIGFAPSQNRLGHVNFRITVDGQTIFNQTLSRAEKRGPIAFEADVSERQRMVFEVGYGEAGSVGDTVHLVNVVLEK